MDQYHRPVLTAEEKFFDQCNTENGKSHSIHISFILVAVHCSAGCGRVHEM